MGPVLTAVRSLFLAIGGIGVALGWWGEEVSRVVSEHATTAVGAIMTIWSAFAGWNYIERRRGNPEQ